MIRESRPIGGYFVNDGSWPVGRLLMYRVFDPTPTIRNGETLEFDDNKYYVVQGGKRIKEGDVIAVDEDLMCMKHNPEKMMLALARIRAAIRESAVDHPVHHVVLKKTIMECTKCL